MRSMWLSAWATQKVSPNSDGHANLETWEFAPQGCGPRLEMSSMKLFVDVTGKSFMVTKVI